jgi:hypothetical protein
MEWIIENTSSSEEENANKVDTQCGHYCMALCPCSMTAYRPC